MPLQENTRRTPGDILAFLLTITYLNFLNFGQIIVEDPNPTTTNTLINTHKYLYYKSFTLT
jgi:hypothetical protein